MCAAPLRPRAVFCHRCGKPFPEEAAVIFKGNNTPAETPELTAQQEVSTNNHRMPQVLVEDEREEPEIVLKTQEAPNFDQNVAEIEKPAEESETIVKKSQQKPRVKHRVVQTTEYVWEESASDPTWKFALATVVLLIFVFLILWLGNFIHF